MNIKHISLALAVAAAALLTGCAKNPIEEIKPSEQLADLELSYVGATETKAAIDGTDFPEEGEIGLFLFKDEPAETPYGESGYTNVKYAYNSDKKKWTANPSIKVGSTPGYLYGYYPYKSGNTDVKEIPVASSLNGDDVMYAEKVSNVTDATASQTAITMNHALARVSIKVINNGYTGKAELSKIKFSGAKIAPEGTLNALDGKITATNSDVTLDVPAADQTIIATGTTYECLLVPSDEISGKQTVELTLTIDGQEKTATLSGDNGVIIAQGTKSNITINLSNSGISVQTVSVEDWNVVEVGGHKVTVRLSEEVGFANDALVDIRTDGSTVTIKSLSALTGRRTSCTCTPDGKATCTPSIDATTGICTFTITNVQDDITAEVGYLKHNVTAVFDSDMGAVKLNGSAVTSGTSAKILYGEEAEFNAEANTGYIFIKWTDGNDNYLSTDNLYTVSSVTSDITLKAIFAEPVEISAEVKPAGAGTVTGAGIYGKGSTATLTAIAGEIYAFTGWAKSDSPGTIISTDNPYEFTVSQSASYVAVFRLKDALSGVFTVAADDQGNPTKKVQFSKGNLYWDGSKYDFESKQYIFKDSWDKNHVSHFYWSKTASVAYAELYSESGQSIDDVLFTNDANFKVSNAPAGVYKSLSKEEWKYLLESRSASTVGETANARYAKATIKVDESTSVPGLILFPDVFTVPESVNTPSEINTNNAGFDSNKYSVEDWSKLESAGAVFLPGAGYRFRGGVQNDDNSGYYWLSSSDKDLVNKAHDLYFSRATVIPDSREERDFGYCVRLVTEVK